MNRPDLRAVCISVALTLVSILVAQALAGGLPGPQNIDADWQGVLVDPTADIAQAIAQIPQDANPLGVRAAHLRTKEYPSNFERVSFRAADDTPLAGMLARHREGRPHPGVVLVPGLPQTMDLKFMVELSDLFARNGWHVLAIDTRGQGESRKLSSAKSSQGWKETQDVLGAVRYLSETTLATSVAVIGFSAGGRSLVKAMAEEKGQLIAAGIAVTAPLGPYNPIVRPEPGSVPSRFTKLLLEGLGARSVYEYYDEAARAYGVDIATMQRLGVADTSIASVSRPLLMLHALDDFFLRTAIRNGRHDGGAFGLAYRDLVKDHPHVRIMLVDQGNHAGMLYLSDPHWFALVTLNYLKRWQARDVEYVTASAPPLDILMEGEVDGQSATFRLALRNHRSAATGIMDVHFRIPPGARLQSCWVGFQGLGSCTQDGDRLSWTVPRLAGSKATAGPFVVTIDVSRLQRGEFETRSWVTAVDKGESFAEDAAVAAPQSVTLLKP